MKDSLRHYIWKQLYNDDRFTGSGDYTDLRTLIFTGFHVYLSKNMAGKGRAMEVSFIIKDEDAQGVELKIDMVFPSYLDRDTVFEGFVETEQDWDRLMVMLGIASRG